MSDSLSAGVALSTLVKLGTKGITFLLNAYFMRAIRPEVFGKTTALHSSGTTHNTLVLEPLRTFIHRSGLFNLNSIQKHSIWGIFWFFYKLGFIFFAAYLFSVIFESTNSFYCNYLTYIVWFAILRPPMVTNEGFQILDLLCLLGCLIDLIDYPVYALAQSQKFIGIVLIFESTCNIFKTLLTIVLVKPQNDDTTNVKYFVYEHFAGSVLSLILSLIFLPYILRKIKEKISNENENQTHQQDKTVESISFKANPQFIPELRTVTGDAIVRYILGHGESLLMMRMMSHKEIGSSHQAKRFCSLLAQIFLSPTEARVFEMVSTERNKLEKEQEQDQQLNKEKEQKENKKNDSDKQEEDSKGDSNQQNREKPKIMFSTSQTSIAELCAFSIRLAIHFGFAFFPYVASLSDEIVLVNLGRNYFNPDSYSGTVPLLIPRLERIFLISLLPMACSGVGEALVRAVAHGKLLLISNTIMASLSAVYLFAVGYGISLGQVLDDGSDGRKFGLEALVEAGKMLIGALLRKDLSSIKHSQQHPAGNEIHFSGAIYIAKLTILNFIVRFTISLLIISLSLNKKKNTKENNEEKEKKEKTLEEKHEDKEQFKNDQNLQFKLRSILPSFTILIYIVISSVLILILRQILHRLIGPSVLLLPPKLEILYSTGVGFLFLIYLMLTCECFIQYFNIFYYLFSLRKRSGTLTEKTSKTQ